MSGGINVIRHPQAAMRCIGTGVSISPSPSIPANALLTEDNNLLTTEGGDALTDES